MYQKPRLQADLTTHDKCLCGMLVVSLIIPSAKYWVSSQFAYHISWKATLLISNLQSRNNAKPGMLRYTVLALIAH